MMRWCRKWLGVLAIAGAAATMAAPAAAHSLDELESQLQDEERYAQMVDRPAPGFALVDAEGQPVRLADMRGKVVVLWFVYTRCPDVCPLHSDLLAEVQQMVNETPMRDTVRFVAITTDPAHDTPDVMRAYGPAHGLDPANWTMLTSGADRPAATREIAQDYGLAFTPDDEGDYQMHGVVTHVIDKSGRLRARYHGLKFDPTNLLVYLNALANDTH